MIDATMQYNALGNTITMRIPVSALDARDKINLLRQLLVDMDDQTANYNDAADLVLTAANRFW